MLRRMGRPGLIGMAARTAVVAGTATAVSGSVQRHQQEKAQQEYDQQQYEAQQQQAQMQAAAQQAAAQQQAAAPAAAGGTDLVAELQKLAALKEQGILSDDEFAAAKARLLG
jgi:putative oligomerization/nucleic acid binding protein